MTLWRNELAILLKRAACNAMRLVWLMSQGSMAGGSASEPYRQWGEDRFVELADRLAVPQQCHGHVTGDLKDLLRVVDDLGDGARLHAG